jgi:hypothetical protein
MTENEECLKRAWDVFEKNTPEQIERQKEAWKETSKMTREDWLTEYQGHFTPLGETDGGTPMAQKGRAPQSNSERYE